MYTLTAHRPAIDERWLIVTRPGSGQFVASEWGTLLFRVTCTGNGMVMIYAWDKKVGREVRVGLTELLERVV